MDRKRLSRRLFVIAGPVLAVAVLLILGAAIRGSRSIPVPPAIDVWYGYEQSFGHNGNPQKWINVLGRVYSRTDIVALDYTLNGSERRPLSIGPDAHRLARPGDFNIEIDRAELKEGENVITVTAEDSGGVTAVSRIIVDYTRGKVWPLPYRIDWDEVRTIQDAAQVVDGLWTLDGRGVRTVETSYDRVLAVGDVTWTDYELTVAITFHDHTPPVFGPPNYGVTHAAVAVRWPGHDADGRQPSVKWYPLGATAEFQVSEDRRNCRWRILGDHGLKQEESRGRSIELEVPYMMKVRVETLVDGGALYRAKLWRKAEPEPAAWDLESREGPADVQAGGALLIAHNTVVTFGDLVAVPVGRDLPGGQAEQAQPGPRPDKHLKSARLDSDI